MCVRVCFCVYVRVLKRKKKITDKFIKFTASFAELSGCRTSCEFVRYFLCSFLTYIYFIRQFYTLITYFFKN